MADRATHHRWDDLEIEELNPLLGRRLITGGDMMIAHVYLKQGCIVPRHAHHNEQLTPLVVARLCLSRTKWVLNGLT